VLFRVEVSRIPLFKGDPFDDQCLFVAPFQNRVVEQENGFFLCFKSILAICRMGGILKTTGLKPVQDEFPCFLDLLEVPHLLDGFLNDVNCVDDSTLYSTHTLWR